MKKIIFSFVLISCFSIEVLSQEADKKFYTDSVKRAEVMQKIIKLAEELRGDNQAVATVLYNLVANMVIKNEAGFATDCERLTNHQLQKEVNELLEERKTIDALKNLLRKSEKIQP